eukprot:COSAG02_NODE_393_length_23190_cov_56.721926_7_plen_475_part_00
MSAGLWLLPLAMCRAALAAPPMTWLPRGITGGGAFFAPALHPTNADTLGLTTDMGSVFLSFSGGDTWKTLDFQQIQGGRPAQLRFTAQPGLVFGVSTRMPDGGDGMVPVKSTDGGITFVPMAAALNLTKGQCFFLDADPASGTRLVVADQQRIYSSVDGGATFVVLHAALNSTRGVRIAGDTVFGQSGLLVIGFNEGVLIVPATGKLPIFLPSPAPDVGILGFAASALPSGGIRLFCLTAPVALVTNNVLIEVGFTKSLELLTALWNASDNTRTLTWAAVPGLPRLMGKGGTLGATYVRTVFDDPFGRVFLAGQCGDSCLPISTSSGGYPFVLQSPSFAVADAANASWTHLFRGVNNTRAGWEGPWTDGPLGDRWSYGGGALGFTVAAAADAGSAGPYRMIFTDDGAVSHCPYRVIPLLRSSVRPANSSSCVGVWSDLCWCVVSCVGVWSDLVSAHSLGVAFVYSCAQHLFTAA